MTRPHRFESFHAACVRTGYYERQLRRVLAFADVEIQRIGNGWQHVDSALVDDAVRRWHASEYVRGAAESRGFLHSQLHRMLVEAGFTPPGKRKRWRLATATIDRVITGSMTRAA